MHQSEIPWESEREEPVKACNEHWNPLNRRTQWRHEDQVCVIIEISFSFQFYATVSIYKRSCVILFEWAFWNAHGKSSFLTNRKKNQPPMIDFFFVLGNGCSWSGMSCSRFGMGCLWFRMVCSCFGMGYSSFGMRYSCFRMGYSTFEMRYFCFGMGYYCFEMGYSCFRIGYFCFGMGYSCIRMGYFCFGIWYSSFGTGYSCFGMGPPFDLE